MEDERMKELKKYVMCYRGADGSNKITSATRNYLVRNNIDVNIEYINLDKRNIAKLVTKLKEEIKPDVVYIWYDEELLQEELEKANIEYVIYDNNKAKSGVKMTYHGQYSKVKKNGIAEEIFKEYKNAQGTIIRWMCGRDNTPVEVVISKFDYDREYNKSKFHKTQLGCKTAILERFKSDKERKESMVETYKRLIADEEKAIEKLTAKIENYEHNLEETEEAVTVDYDDFKNDCY